MRGNRIGALLALGLVAGACGGSSDRQGTDEELEAAIADAIADLEEQDVGVTSDNGSVDDPSADDEEPAAEPFERVFEGLVSHSGRYADLTVEVVEARLQRGEDHGYPSVLGDVFAEIDVQLENVGNSAVEWNLTYWDLMLSDGDRLGPWDAPRETLAARDKRTFTLVYPADEQLLFDGAELEVNGGIGTREPLRIPLDGESGPPQAQRLMDLAGHVFEPGEFGLRLEILDAIYDFQAPGLNHRSPFDMRTVSLDIEVTYLTANNSQRNFFDDHAPRVIVDGRSQLTAEYVNEILSPSEPFYQRIYYDIPADADEFELAFIANPEEPEQTVVVNLSNVEEITEGDAPIADSDVVNGDEAESTDTDTAIDDASDPTVESDADAGAASADTEVATE